MLPPHQFTPLLFLFFCGVHPKQPPSSSLWSVQAWLLLKTARRWKTALQVPSSVYGKWVNPLISLSSCSFPAFCW